MRNLNLVGLLSGCLAAAVMTPSHAWAAASPDTAPTASSAASIELPWLTDFPQAQSRAKAEGKSVLLFFHGSDWCPPCVEMEREVFASPQFVQVARKALVLVNVDFPARLKQDEALRRANLALKAKFNLSQETGEGFPTIVLLDDAGHTVFQETGYAAGSSGKVLARLEDHLRTGRAASHPGAFQDLSIAEFEKMAADKHNVILDVRTPAEFHAGHIAGAINLDVTAADFQQKAGALDHNQTFLVHCASGVRSVRACEQLSRLDFLKLYNLPGGFKAWVKAGKPVEQ